MAEIGIGVLGCGQWGPNFVRIFHQMRGARLLAVCDASGKRLQNIQDLYPTIQTVRSVEALFTIRGIDAWIVATPAQTHFEMARVGLRAGKHLLVEKPLSLSLKKAKHLISLAKEKKRILMVGHTFQYNPHVRELRKMIRQGALGRIYYLFSIRTNLGPLRNDIGAVLDLSPHDLSICSYLLDSHPYEVSCQGHAYLQRRLEDVAFMTLRYPKEILCGVHVSWLNPKKVRQMVVVGSKRMVVFDDLDNVTPIRIYNRRVQPKRLHLPPRYQNFSEYKLIIQEGNLVAPPPKMGEPLRFECEHFLNCIRTGKKPLSDGSSGLEIVRTLEALRRSLAQGGKPVRIKR